MQISVVRSTPFNLTKKQSLPKIVPHILSKHKHCRSIAQNSSDEDREAVQHLTEWEKRGITKELPISITEAKTTLKKRILGQDIVEDIKFKRKHKSKYPQLTGQQSIPLIKSMQSRQIRKEAEENFKERCRYLKIYEEDLKKSREKILSDIQEIKDLRVKHREELLSIKKKAVKFNEELESLKENLIRHESDSKARKNQEELTAWMVKKLQLKEQVKVKEQKKVDLGKEVQSEVEKKYEVLEKLDKDIKDLKDKSETLKNTLAKHYLGLLKEGKDTRSQGLQWIVLALWKLGETVTIDNFPAYLDPDSVHFILFLAQRTLEMEEILNRLISPSRQTYNSYSRVSNNVQSVKRRLAALTKNFQTNKPEYIFNNGKKKYSVHWVPFSQSGEDSLVSIVTESHGYYEGYMNKLKEVIDTAVNNEIQRLTIECTLHNYEERYKTSIKDLISAICGVESIDKHLAGVTKRKKYLTGVLEGNRSASINF